MLQHGFIRRGRIHKARLTRSSRVALLFLTYIFKMRGSSGLHLTDVVADVHDPVHLIFVTHLHPVRGV